jgi:hypothetical protein
MNGLIKREVIVEVEKVRILRKRAKTVYMICKECGCKADFVSLDDAALVFETASSDLIAFAAANNCHIQKCIPGGVHLCLIAFIAAMKRNNSNIKLIGD